MQKMIACCGLVCSNCPAYIATMNDDDEARAETAAYFSKRFGFKLKPEDINCEGCTSSGNRVIGYCHACHIRKCCSAKGLTNCSFCSKLPCEHLEKIHAVSAEARKNFQDLLKARRNNSK